MTKQTKFTPHEQAKLEKAFRQGEANVRLEGLEPTEFYQGIKRRILAGEMT